MNPLELSNPWRVELINNEKISNFDPSNPMNRQPSVSKVLKSASFQLAENIDKSLRLTHRRPSNTYIKGLNKTPQIKVTKKKEENAKIAKIIEIL